MVRKARRNEGINTVSHFRAEQVANIRQVLVDRPRDLSLFDTGIHLGLRGGDLLNLEWPQALNKALSDIGENITLVEQKTDRRVTLPITTPIRQALLRWWKISGEPVEGPIWPSRKGGSPMKIGYLHSLVNKWAMVAGLEGHFGSHSLRKTFGRAFLAQGGTIYQLALRFGHKSIETTGIYLGLDVEEVNEVANGIDLTKSLDTKPNEVSRPKLRRRKVQQGAFVTNQASNKADAEVPRIADHVSKLSSPKKDEEIQPNQQDNSEASGYPVSILADCRKLSIVDQIWVTGEMAGELKTLLLHSLRGKGKNDG